MKTKFSIELHLRGSFNDAIVRMVTNHNEGLVKINFSTLIGHINGTYCCWPTVTPKTECKINYKDGTMDIIEGDKHTITVRLKEIEELKVEDVPTLFVQPEGGIIDPEMKENIN